MAAVSGRSTVDGIRMLRTPTAPAGSAIYAARITVNARTAPPASRLRLRSTFVARAASQAGREEMRIRLENDGNRENDAGTLSSDHSGWAGVPSKTLQNSSWSQIETGALFQRPRLYRGDNCYWMMSSIFIPIARCGVQKML